MQHRPRNTYELMNWAAEQNDLDPAQRKELYYRLEKKNVLGTSKDPWKEAVKLAKDIKKQEKIKKKSGEKSLAKGKKGTVKDVRAKPTDDLDQFQDDYESDALETFEGVSWYDDDVDREDYPDYYESDY